MIDERISIAPMMEWTDAHYRMMMRSLTRKTVLYTEMVVDETVKYSLPGSLDFYIGKHIQEEPSVIQLGGSDPQSLADAAEICEQYSAGYGEINLNCGCPSQRVAKKCFGAKLMLNPDLVREIVYSMQRRVSIPVTVKCRIGADELDTYDNLKHFITSANAGGVKKFVIHARKCLLSGLTTKQNREIPPLRHEVVHRLVRDFPELTFVLNGGIQSLQQGVSHLNQPYQFDGFHEVDGQSVSVSESLPVVHGVMVGRVAYSNPLQFATADSTFFGVRDPGFSRRQVMEQYIDYCEWAQSELGPHRTAKGRKQGVSTSVLINSMRNIVCEIKHAQQFRIALNDIYMEKLKGVNGVPNPSPREVILGAMEVLSEEDLDAPMGNVHGFDDEIRTIGSVHSAPSAPGTVSGGSGVSAIRAVPEDACWECGGGDVESAQEEQSRQESQEETAERAETAQTV